jgi:murein L,D-transpeptidase YafK
MSKKLKSTRFLFIAVWKYRHWLRPLLKKINGGNTVDSVIERLEKTVFFRLEQDLQNSGFSDYPKEITLVAIKSKRIVEVWGLLSNRPVKIKTYPFTAFSGKEGPKLKEGDKQIPEGIYDIEYLNPNSLFYLSMKLSYPNSFDLERAAEDGRKNLGGDIMIHGKSVTIGCIPVGDVAIEELFLLVAKAGVQNCRVVVAPVDFRKAEKAPVVTEVDWTKELYEDIEREMKKYQL